MVTTKRILDNTLEKIKIPEKELLLIKKKANSLITSIKKTSKEIEVVLGGSLAKGTLIKKY